MSLVASGLASVAVTTLAMPVVIAALRRVQIIDVPNQRSSHSRPTVRGAGWGVLLGAVAGWCVGDVGAGAWWLPVVAIVFGVVGFADDLRSLSSAGRFALQVAVGGGALVAAQGAEVVHLSPFAQIVLAGAFIAYINAFNFMDGVNGISGLQGLAVGVALVAAGSHLDAANVQYGGLVIAGACLAFLPFNAPRARCFLGDVGSYFIGAWLIAVCVLAYDAGAGTVFVGSLIAIYAADTAYTVARRVRNGDAWWTAHREHVYQRLTDSGFSHLASALVVTAFTAACALVGFVAIDASAPAAVGCAVMIAALCLAYLTTPAWLRGRNAAVQGLVS